MKKLLIALLLTANLGFAVDSVPPKFPIKDSGTPLPFSFEKFGVFSGRGTNDYKFKINDRPGLAKATGSGIYPNFTSLQKDPAYVAWKKKHPGDIVPWDYVDTDDPQTDFYVWASAKDVGPGTKLFFTAKALAAGGHTLQALKAYYSVLVHFPKEPCWSADHTFVWYVAGEALSQIDILTQQVPEFGYRLRKAKFKVTNGNDTDLENDVFEIDPGTWEKSTANAPVDVSKLKIINQRGGGKVRLVQYENKHWQLQVEGKPMTVRGITYNPTPIGKHLSDFGLQWMAEDSDGNNLADAPFDTWLDRNLNNKQDADEVKVGDFQLMKDMRVNAIRIYRQGESIEYDPKMFNKPLLRDLTKKYGIRVIMGDFLGAYTIGSGASWEEGTDYTDPVQLENMRSLITAYVKDHRSEPYVLMWILGNENLVPADFTGLNATRTKAAVQVEAYLKFVNEIANLIHKLDPDHPVAVGNLGIQELEAHGKYAPNVDIFGANLYKGANGFGTLWSNVADYFDRPVMITEYGCDSFDSKKDAEDQDMQAKYHEGNWEDIRRHLAGGPYEGNAIGGVIFEYTDEWWKSPPGTYTAHDDEKDSAMAFPDGWASEEWFGVMSLGNGSNDPFMRQPRKVYYLYRDKLWK